MDYFIEWFLDRLSARLRSRLWDLIFLFLQDDESLSLPEMLPLDSPASGTAMSAWTGSAPGTRAISTPK